MKENDVLHQRRTYSCFLETDLGQMHECVLGYDADMSLVVNETFLGGQRKVL